MEKAKEPIKETLKRIGRDCLIIFMGHRGNVFYKAPWEEDDDEEDTGGGPDGPMEDNRWDDMGTYFEGDLASVPKVGQLTLDLYHEFQQQIEGTVEAPNGWSDPREYAEAHWPKHDPGAFDVIVRSEGK